VCIDVTAFPVAAEEDAWSAANAWELYQQMGCPGTGITVSSDGGGCLPVFNSNGEMIHMDFASSAGLPETLFELLGRGHPLEQILPCMTSNVAALLRLRSKGHIAIDGDADLVVLDKTNIIRDVMAQGNWMLRAGTVLKNGTFESK
jgi:beta-aspartyl-dipeptidase (metallo-type)